MTAWEFCNPYVNAIVFFTFMVLYIVGLNIAMSGADKRAKD